MPKAKPVVTNQLTTSNIAHRFSDEEAAWGLLERLRWPNGPACPHCGVVNDASYLAPKSGYRRTRAGNVTYRRLWQCREQECRQQFSVLVGTVMEDTHIPVSKWLLAMHLLCSGKNGVSAHELHRTLGITYKSAWFMAYRIRHAMEMPPFEAKLTEHLSEWHLPRYLGEFDDGYNNRKVRDGARTEQAIRQTAGKRLMYRDSLGAIARGSVV